MDEEALEEFLATPPSRKWTWKCIPVVLIRFFADIHIAAGERLLELSNYVVMSMNSDLDKSTFHEQAAREIESITED